MYHAGIDYHKRYSIVSIRNAQGSIVQEQRVEHAFPELFGGLFGGCPEPMKQLFLITGACPVPLRPPIVTFVPM